MSETTLTPSEAAARLFPPGLSARAIDDRLRLLTDLLIPEEQNLLRRFCASSHIGAHTEMYRPHFITKKMTEWQPALDKHAVDLNWLYFGWTSLNAWKHRFNGTTKAERNTKIHERVEQYRKELRQHANVLFLKKDPGSPHFEGKEVFAKAAALESPYGRAIYQHLNTLNWREVPFVS